MIVGSPPTPRFGTPPTGLLNGRSHLWRFTREDVAALARLGIIPEDASTELLDGLIVHTDRAARGEDIFRIGKGHRIAVERLSNLRSQLNTHERHVECQQPLACSEFDEPQPDFMVVRGKVEDCGEDGPTAADVFCVIEVADSSYERDAGVKLTTYARAGVPQYIILNLRNRTAEVYETPNTTTGTYPPPRIILSDGLLVLRVGQTQTFSLPLKELLP